MHTPGIHKFSNKTAFSQKNQAQRLNITAALRLTIIKLQFLPPQNGVKDQYIPFTAI